MLALLGKRRADEEAVIEGDNEGWRMNAIQNVTVLLSCASKTTGQYRISDGGEERFSHILPHNQKQKSRQSTNKWSTPCLAVIA